ncbi:MAG: DUF4234 domain-containing protein [Acetobacter sp.]|nr:DUF4234 domain-containing protein [Acetobacter sp.]
MVMTAQEISRKNGLSTWKLLGLSIITGSVFCYYWMKKMTELVEAFSGKRIWKDRTFIIILVISFGLNDVVAQAYINGESDFIKEALLIIYSLGVIVVTIMMICWAFAAKREIELYASQALGISYRMKGFYAFLFNGYYINYCLNDLAYEAVMQRKEVQLN